MRSGFIILLFSLLLFVAFSQSSKDKTCKKGVEYVNCLKEWMNYGSATHDYQDNFGSSETVVKKCNDYATCLSKNKCDNEKGNETIKVVKSGCSLIGFLLGKFEKCLKTIRAAGYECGKNFDANLLMMNGEFDKDYKTNCEKTLGKDNCMHDRVSEVCGDLDARDFDKFIGKPFTNLCRTKL